MHVEGSLTSKRMPPRGKGESMDVQGGGPRSFRSIQNDVIIFAFGCTVSFWDPERNPMEFVQT